MTTSSSSTLRFGTILSARSNHSPPSELEICLRSHCQRLKVVSNQLNGAHLLIPPASSGEATLAVRAYYSTNLLPDIPAAQAWSEITSSLQQDDLDGLARFQQSFALTIVLFVLTQEEKNRHLDNTGSFVRRTMHQLMTRTFQSPSLSASSNTTRVLIVPSSEAAVQALVAFADALAPAKRQLKQAFYEQQRQAHYVPPSPNSEETAALHALRALREWAFRNHIPEYEMDIVVKLLGNLEAIVEHAATGLNTIPISRRTKTLLHYFFHGASSTDWSALVGTGASSTVVPPMPPQGLSRQGNASFPLVPQPQQHYLPPLYHNQQQQPANYLTSQSNTLVPFGNLGHSSFAMPHSVSNHHAPWSHSNTTSQPSYSHNQTYQPTPPQGHSLGGYQTLPHAQDFTPNQPRQFCH